ncbi:hypothetical protein ACKTEK_07190 [Tepidamorphus sp. 3E244]|uniref:hypothetical protein n=1 Tax=Tepidamorphus sp. 3E244 TaxID=3385498 RepID=UPI0038FBF4C1
MAALALAAIFPAGSAFADDTTPVSQRGGQQYCVSCYGETNDMTSKRTCYEISVPTQIHMRAFGIRQCTALSGNLWYNFADGSCKGKRYCNKVIKK